MTINTETLSEEQRKTSAFEETYSDFERKLNSPGFIPALCAHEAAHLFYYQMLGPIEYKCLPPTIKFESTTGQFGGYLAAIQLIKIPECRGDNWREWITLNAHAAVAGSVVGRRLYPRSDGGPEGDRTQFKRLCSELIAHAPDLQMDADLVWVRAVKAVEKQINDYPEILQAIQEKAAELRPLFGL